MAGFIVRSDQIVVGELHLILENLICFYVKMKRKTKSD